MRLLLTLFLLAAASLSMAAGQPNVVFVITDDQGYGDLSCHGNPVLRTPHLDRLHTQSARFTNFHVSPTCSPSRSAIMSGRHTNRSGAWHTIMARSILFEGETTLGHAFADNGYATGMFGKWHLGDNYPFRPEDRGFGTVVRHGGGGIGQTPDVWNNAYFDCTYHVDGRLEERAGYCTDVFFAEAREFIDQSVEQGKPFFAYIATNAPHGPLHCPEEYTAPYRDRVDTEGEAVFFGMIANLDENVGALREWLADRGLAENTLLVFMTDNGTASGQRVFNAGMRGAKGSEYEGGHRVPFFVHWPAGGIDKPQDIDRLAAHIDVLPTLQELCGLNPQADYALDGRSLAPLLHDPGADWTERVIVTDSQRVRDPIKWRKSSTMTDRWRLINGVELYDLTNDPGQRNDVAAEQPATVQWLRAAYETWWEDISPAFSRQARIVLGNPAENPSRLTCHDWLTSEGNPPWNQSHIREGLAGEGEWAVRVERAGKYRIELRRWPHEATTPLTAGLAPGKAVPGLAAYRETVGQTLPIQSAGLRIGSFQAEKTIDADRDSVSFEVTLEAGPASLVGYFDIEGGERIGAYYADIELLD